MQPGPGAEQALARRFVRDRSSGLRMDDGQSISKKCKALFAMHQSGTPFVVPMRREPETESEPNLLCRGRGRGRLGFAAAPPPPMLSTGGCW